MQISWNTIISILYPAALVGLFMAAMWWRLRRRTTKHPLGEDVRLMRQPGEHLRRQVSSVWQGLFWRISAVLFIPGVAFCIVAGVMVLVAPTAPLWALAFPIGAALAGLYGGIQWLCNYTDGIFNMRLGLFGERAVADQLEGLKKKGYEVFHDVPCVGGSGSFNLDHVVVGKGVVVVVETKTLSKPKDVKDGHKVNYNGQVLTWPSGATSTRELEQALRNAEWLRKELKKQVNVEAVVHPALTFPGWFVNGGPPQAPVLVESYSRLPSFIEQRFPPRLSPPETDAVVRHLNRLCTNLDYADVE